jgi:hypothetical protein
MNLQELRARVRSLTNVYSSSVLSDAAINTAVNDAVAAVCASEVWPPMLRTQTLNVVAGTSTYNLSTSTGVPRDIVSVANQNPTGLVRNLLQVTMFDTEARSRPAALPEFYTASLDGTPPTLTLLPTPAANEELTVVVRIRPTVLTNNTDVPPFLGEFHPTFAYRAAAVLLTERRGDERKIAQLTGLAQEHLELMRRRYLVSHDASRVNVGSRRGGRWRSSRGPY